tara:strand:- start:225 stop:368 length:144 start_codon:yes stop_codon:yes gene_type:complete
MVAILMQVITDPEALRHIWHFIRTTVIVSVFAATDIITVTLLNTGKN